MRFCSVPPLLLALLWAVASVAALRAADDPGALFLQVYQTYQFAAKLEVDGRPDEALQKFRFCVSLLEQIQKANPEYEPIVIDHRLRKSREAIARVQSIPEKMTGNVMVTRPTAISARQIEHPITGFPNLSTTYRIPMPGSSTSFPSLTHGGAVEVTDGTIGRGKVGAIREEIRALKMEIEQQRLANEDLSRRLLESTAREQMAFTEVDRTKVRVVELQAQITQTSQMLEDFREANNRLSRERESGQRQIVALETALEAAHADLEVADEYNNELYTKLERAAQFIEADEKIRTQLLGERKELSTRLVKRTGEAAKIEKERAVAVAKTGSLQKRIADAVKLEDQNKSLATKLAAAERQLSEFSSNQKERRKIEDGLRSEVLSVNKSLAAMRDQLKSGNDRITELEKQLTDTASATAGATGALAEENALLKSLVVRQLQEQAKRQQARKLVEEEMEKLRIRSTDLLARLDAMAGVETSLTSREKKLVERSIVGVSGHSDFALEVIKKTPESDLPRELVARAAEANELSQKRQFAEARSIYQEIAQKAPQSYLAAVNLGIAERQLGAYPQAIAAFRRALELKRDDPFALTNLGTVEYRAGNFGEAVNVLQQAVEADSESYLAHYLLGMALNDRGDRKGARHEVRKSLDLKPDYVPAVELATELEEESDEPSASSSPQVAQ